MLSVRARRLVVLLATLTTLVLTGCAAVTTTSSPTGVGVQNRVWAFTPAAQLLAPPTRSQSSCSRPGFTVSAVGMASGFCVAAEAGTNVFRAGEAAGGGGISLDQAAAAASRNGIDMRMFDLRYEPGPNFGFMSQTGSGALVRGAGGRIALTLQDAGLASEQDAVETIAHELNHIRGVLNNGLVTDEPTAEAAAQAAGRYFR